MAEREKEWYPSLDFICAIWRGAGQREPNFGMKIAQAYDYDDRESAGADILLEIIKASGPIPPVVSRCIALLDAAKRGREAESLITELKSKLLEESDFLRAWATHALRSKRKEALLEFVAPPLASKL